MASAMVPVAAAVCALAPGVAAAAPRRAASTPADRAAVHTYFLDLYSYARAVSEATPTLIGDYEDAASAIAGECPGVLVGAPQGHGIEAGSSILGRSARQRGEEKRQSTQLDDLEEELATELASAEQEARRPAEAAFLAKLKALPHGDPALARVVHADTAARSEEDQQEQSTEVCSDMKAWAASGYRALSQASRTIALAREAELAKLLTDLSTQSLGDWIPLLETRADRALAGRAIHLEVRTAKAISKPLDSARRRVEAALGLTTRAKSEESLKSTSHESRSSTKLGTVRTAAGTRYTVWLERRKGGPAGMCKSSVEVRRASEVTPGLSELIISGESGLCLKPHRKRLEKPRVECGEGLLTIESQVPSSTHTVDLRLSNGAHVISRPVFVPRRLGGPSAVYYQAVRGPAPIPVSLTYRDARGRALGTLKLRRMVGCSRHPLKYLPGGRRTLTSGKVPDGPSFSIVGERYRLFGRVHAKLTLKTGDALGSSGDDEEESAGEGPIGPFSMPVRRVSPLDSQISAGCQPHEYSIFFGFLRQPRDTVQARIDGKLVPALRLPIPSSLHARGLLVYIASAGRPEEVVVRSPSGKIVANEDLSRAASEERETCEGESEGAAGPPPGGFGAIGETTSIELNG